MLNNREKMQWTVLIVATAVLVVSVFVSFFKDQNLTAVAGIFVGVSGLVLGAGVINKMKGKSDD